LNLGRSTADRPEAVEENRRRVLSALDFDPGRLVTLGQVHGARVRRAEESGFQPECDAVVTRATGLALAVTGADCLPLLLVTEGALGAAHAGWRGIVAGVVEAALAAVCEESGLPPAAARVHLGPCIRACCYQVSPDVASQFPGEVVSTRERSLHLDLPAAVRLRLMTAGLPREAFEDTGACTACDPRRYFSHRRDHGITGRHWGVVGWRDVPA
jgi:hypothetical protein